jgi:bifunctional non-homologous end joining protein LigD
MPPRSDFILPCIPTRAYKVPAGPDWIHEIKHDGYRLQVRRQGDAVRLFTRRGYDWTTRYPAIANTALELKASTFTLEGAFHPPTCEAGVSKDGPVRRGMWPPHG